MPDEKQAFFCLYSLDEPYFPAAVHMFMPGNVVKHLMNLTDRMASVENTVVRIETRMENEIINKIQVPDHLHHETRLDRVEKELSINI